MRRQDRPGAIQPGSLTPVGEQLGAILLSDIRSGRYAPSTRIPSERELAETYRISRTSVRESIAQLISQGVLVRRERQGAFVAPTAVAPPLTGARTIAFLVSRHLLEFFQIRNSRILSGVEDCLHESGGRVIFHTIGEDPASVRLEPLLRGGTNGIAGCILSGTVRRQTIEAVRGAGLPFVLVDRDAPAEQDRVVSVRADYGAGTRLAMRRLHELGHRRIGFIGFADSLKYRAFCDSLNEFGLAHDPGFVEFIEVFDLPPAILAGYEAMDRILARRKPPDCILVTNDLVAVGVIERLRIGGIEVPEGISVVGFDDLGQRTNPPLTRVRADMAGLGRAAAESLLCLIDGRRIAQNHILAPVEFITAGSTAARR
ncbi:MAG: GntR family transcriptional regulator [Acidobacteria bacterium]|nr:GntR family transcriptional regulator [Acidobacteriota bacterium]